MATQTGKVQNFQKVALILGLGHRVDAFDAAGIGLAWQGDKVTVTVGPGGIATYVDTGVSYGIITVTLSPASDSIDYIWAWVTAADPRLCSLKDSNGRTFLTDPKAMPRQRGDMTFNATANPVEFNIHCPQLSGPQGGLNT